ncbi:MAG: hypothetical protein GX620_11605 [Chloroflexi bacterium]|nr:hypothetical protein [Chloroflexota bacterium]
MDKHRLLVGSIKIINGEVLKRTEHVEFEGHRLASRSRKLDDEGTRGYTETLYYTSDRKLLVHLEDWSVQRGEGTIYTILEVTRQDLQTGGTFEELGQSAWAWLRR